MIAAPVDRYRAVFKRLETDEELRARAGCTHVTIERKVTRYGWYGIPSEGTTTETVRLDKLTGAALDDALWNALKMQRRIVEDVQR